MRSQQTVDSEPASDSAPISPPADLSAESKLVYLYLHTADGCNVDELQANLGLKKLSLFPVLRSLTERGLVRRDGSAYLPQSS